MSKHKTSSFIFKCTPHSILTRILDTNIREKKYTIIGFRKLNLN